MTAAGATPLAAGLLERERALTAFLDEHGAGLARTCHDLARSFGRGGLLLAHGTGGAATDAAHVAVALMHPDGAAERSLPALAPSSDPTGAARRARAFRQDDIALSVTHGPADLATGEFLDAAARQGALTVALLGAGGPAPHADHVLTVDSTDPHVVQEVLALARHAACDLVHRFFEHPGLLEESCVTCGDIALPGRIVALTEHGATADFDGVCEEVACELIEQVAVGDLLLCHAGVAIERIDTGPEDGPVPASFLYPFLERVERDIDVVLGNVCESFAQQGREALRLQRGLDVTEIERCAAEIRKRLLAGGRLLSFGNGGSAAGAQDLAGEMLDLGWAATALSSDGALLTAVADDVGFGDVFARQVMALGQSRDVVVALAADGESPNVVRALAAAGDRGMLTCAIGGDGGEQPGRLDGLDHLLSVGSDDVPRAQEAQATLYHLIIEAIGRPT